MQSNTSLILDRRNGDKISNCGWEKTASKKPRLIIKS